MKYSVIRAVNPLYASLQNPPFFMPDFRQLAPADFKSAFNVAIFDATMALNKIAQDPVHPTFENTVEAYVSACEVVNHFYRIFLNLTYLREIPELESIEGKITADIIELRMRTYYNHRLFSRLEKIERHKEKASLSDQQKILIGKIYKEFIEAGARLPVEKRLQVVDIDLKMAGLRSLYLKANKKYIRDSFRIIIDEAMLAGVPAEKIAQAKQEALKRGLYDAWVITGDTNTWFDFVLNGQSRELRRLLYKPDDTTGLGDLLKAILHLRHRRARLFGYRTHFRYRNADTMIEKESVLKGFLDQFRPQVRSAVAVENRALSAFAKAQGLPHLERHDRDYYQEKLKQQTLGFSDQTLKPYLNVNRVRDTIFNLIGHLFDVEFKPVTGLSGWHEDLETYDVYDKAGLLLRGRVCLDLFARPQKMEGAWCEVTSSHGQFQGHTSLPYVNIACNFARAPEKSQSRLTLYDVATFFHEMGHGMHCLMGKTDYQPLSGFNGVTFDAVEFFSQILENFTYEPWVIDQYARHEVTGEPLPEDIKENIMHIRSFMGGTTLKYALESTYLDMLLHMRSMKRTEMTRFEVDKLAELFPGRSKQYVWAPIFPHIVVYNYDAAYHSYLFSETIEANAYSQIDPALPDFPQRLKNLRAAYEAACLQKPRALFEPLTDNNVMDVFPVLERYGLAGYRPEFVQVKRPLGPT